VATGRSLYDFAPPGARCSVRSEQPEGEGESRRDRSDEAGRSGAFGSSDAFRRRVPLAPGFLRVAPNFKRGCADSLWMKAVSLKCTLSTESMPSLFLQELLEGEREI